MPLEKKKQRDFSESPHGDIVPDYCRNLASFHRRSTYIHYLLVLTVIQILASPANCLLHNEHFRRQRTTQASTMDSTPASLPLRKFCLGTENGRNTISIEGNMNHYQRLKKSYIRCKRIIGNLEITHIDQEDIQKDYDQKVREEQLRTNGSLTAVDIPRDHEFHFFKDLEEVSGYILIFNVRVQSISFPNLKIIWGEKNHEGNALQIDSSVGLRYLNLPSLRSIENGNVTIKRSPDLCYMDPSREFVDYSELLGPNPHNRIKIAGQFSNECRHVRSCSSNCDNSCFGPSRDQCQTIYRRICLSCESKACYLDSQNTPRCCDDACAGGCYGDGKEKCVACKKFEQDGKCVNSCTGTHFYNPTGYVKEEYPDEEKRYAYGRHCVNKCPSGTLIEERYCVARCSPGNYRDAQRDDRTCVPCNGPCPKVCQMTERINSLNIRNFINCSEIEGNIEILNHVFQEHYPDGSPGIRMDRLVKTIPPLTAADLDVLRSVKIVTGHVVIDGGRQNNPNKPTSLAFLENLEMIEGRQLYYEKYSLYVIGNNDLKWLGLKSLRKIKNGLVSFSQNRNLCYSYSIPFNSFLGVKDSVWRANMNNTECENLGRKCHSTCDPTLGCWGPGPKMCVRCRHYTRDGQCSDSCPAEGYFLLEDGRTCERCHEQCLTCYGTEATQCHKCRNFERWAPIADQLIRADDNKIKTCIAKCPNETYAVGSLCEPCHEACYEYGCTGPKAHYGPEGCNRCRYTMFDDEYSKLKCFTAESEQTACTPMNNMPPNYFIGLDTQNISKYICQQCRSECLSCKREGISPSADGCVCSNYIIHDEESEANAMCANECGKGSFLVLNKTDENIGECVKCHHLCDNRYSCSGPLPTQCDRCAVAGLLFNDTIFECLSECPDYAPYAYEGVCQEEDKEVLVKRRRNTIISAIFAALLLFAFVITYLIYRCINYRKKYEKEQQMHMPEIPPTDTTKATQRPNMRRVNLISVDELDDSNNSILGQGAFGIVYAGKWKPPTKKGISIPVAIKAINPEESRHTSDAEVMKEAGLMAAIQHEHLLPLVGICLGGSMKGGIKIVTILRPLGSLHKFLDQHKTRLGSKNLMVYCFQISSAMEFLAKKKIVHRDLATRNVLVKNINHVEVTDFGLAQMLQGSETSVVIEGRVAVKWLAIESLRHQVYNEKTDVWSFGVTCWEILTFAQKSPYTKELDLPRDQRLARALAEQLEKGYRLKQPDNCSQELYQEMLNCWLVDPDSRPSFRQLKEIFENFCRAPHIYIQERQATQRMDSITSSEQRLMIERLLKDTDFLDPIHLDSAEYALSSPTKKGNDNAFFSSNTLETVVPMTGDSPTTPTRPLMCGEQMRHGSTGTNSTRYKSDPVFRKRNLSSTDESRFSELDMDEENYLMPKTAGRSIIGKSIDEEDESADNGFEDRDGAGSLYTPVIPDKPGFPGDDALYAPTYLNELNGQREYANNGTTKYSNMPDPMDSKELKSSKIGSPQLVPYVNAHQSETTI